MMYGVATREKKKRIKLKDRVLPSYTKGEEIFNMVTHIVGGGVGILVSIACIIVAALNQNTAGVITSTIFGTTMISLYTMSSIYHGLREGTAKKVFQIIDHCTIYFLIAGTYTPLMACSLAKTAPVNAWLTLGAVWAMAALATTLTAIDLKKYKVFSNICYVGMGWAVIFSMKETYHALGTAGFWLLLSGGLAYTVGVVFYALGKKIKYFHSIFHIFVLAGSVLQSLCIIFYSL
jgi:hemolysin III